MDKLEIAKEAAIIYFEENISAAEAIEKAKKECLDTDQSIQDTNLNENIIADIISHVLDIDNGQVYKPNTNEVIGDIEEVLK